jgi:hypothetical protein
LLFEFHVERTHTFYRVELRDRGAYGSIRPAGLAKSSTCNGGM